jgi:hypothetical protein
MKLAGTLLSYALTVGVLCAALIGGVLWLIQPGAAIPHEARAATIPPRIADSIERRKPIPVQTSEPAPARPVMTEANASLTPAPVRPFKIRELNPPPKQHRKPRGETAVADVATAAIRTAAPVISTARTDVPF